MLVFAAPSGMFTLIIGVCRRLASAMQRFEFDPALTVSVLMAASDRHSPRLWLSISPISSTLPPQMIYREYCNYQLVQVRSLTTIWRCMSEQLSLLNTSFPYAKLFGPSCELNVKPKASYVRYSPFLSLLPSSLVAQRDSAQRNCKHNVR